MKRPALAEQRAIVYQSGREYTGLVSHIMKGILRNQRSRELFFPHDGIIWNNTLYRGRGEHLPEVKTLHLLHDYKVRDVQEDFAGIAGAFTTLGYDLAKPIMLVPASGQEQGLHHLNSLFDWYRLTRDMPTNVTIERVA